MRCEICGKKVVGQPVRVKIEGSVMQTCQECSKFGKVQKEPAKKIIRKRTPSHRPRFREPSDEVLEDFNTIIRMAREKLGWSRDDLAEKVYEKSSVIGRIESGKMVPDIKLARKLEKTLNITLVEKVEDVNLADKGNQRIRGATIGDIAFIKRNR